MEFEVGDVVMCTVDRIAGTIVFVKIDKNIEGSIVLSEIAPGRIRNLREYVVPKKRIICKIIRINKNRIDLSLRRVTQKEKKDFEEKHRQEKSYISILKNVLKEKAEDIINKISEKDKLFDFFQGVKENPKKLEEIVGKKDAEKILEIIDAQKKKKYVIKKEITLTTAEPAGLNAIKNILGKIKNAKVTYISAGKYSLKTEAEDIKTADKVLKDLLKNLEEQSKKENISFSIKEK